MYSDHKWKLLAHFKRAIAKTMSGSVVIHYNEKVVQSTIIIKSGWIDESNETTGQIEHTPRFVYLTILKTLLFSCLQRLQ